MGMGRSASVAMALVLGLSSCSAVDEANPGATESGLPEVSPEAVQSTAAPSAPGVPTPQATAVPKAATAPTPTAITEGPAVLPDQQSDAGAEFNACAQRYLQRAANPVLNDRVTPLVIEAWAQAYRSAAQLAAEGDMAGAAVACIRIEQAMAALGS